MANEETPKPDVDSGTAEAYSVLRKVMADVEGMPIEDLVPRPLGTSESEDREHVVTMPAPFLDNLLRQNIQLRVQLALLESRTLERIKHYTKASSKSSPSGNPIEPGIQPVGRNKR